MCHAQKSIINDKKNVDIMHGLRWQRRHTDWRIDFMSQWIRYSVGETEHTFYIKMTGKKYICNYCRSRSECGL